MPAGRVSDRRGRKPVIYTACAVGAAGLLIAGGGHAMACGLTIAPGTAGFLVIIFNGFGYIVMYHKSNIWFVNTHPKCNGGYYYLYIFIQKQVLSFGPQFAF